MEKGDKLASQEQDIQRNVVGIIGYGKFGQLLHHKLLPQETTIVYDTQPLPEEGLNQAQNLETLAAASTIIIPSVPINQFRSVIEQISPYIQPRSLVMDVCSVKEYPTQVMLDLLPKDVHIISTHPMFGPKGVESQNGSLNDLRMVMSNIRCDPVLYEGVKVYFHSLGLEIIELSPEEHDKLAARSQFFAQTIRHISQKLDLQQTKIDTPAAVKIFNDLKLMGSDETLFRDMLKYNSYCASFLGNMIQVLTDLQE